MLVGATPRFGVWLVSRCRELAANPLLEPLRLQNLSAARCRARREGPATIWPAPAQNPRALRRDDGPKFGIASLLTVNGCRAVIHILDEQHCEVQPLQDLVHLLGAGLGASLVKEKFKDAPKLVAGYTALKQQFPANVEYVDRQTRAIRIGPPLASFGSSKRPNLRPNGKAA